MNECRSPSPSQHLVGPVVHPQLAQCVTGKRQDLHVNMQCTVVAVLACRNVLRAGQRCEDGLGLPRPLQVEQRNASAKFPDAVEAATGIRPALPPRLADLFERPEKADDIGNDLGALEAFIDAAKRQPAGVA